MTTFQIGKVFIKTNDAWLKIPKPHELPNIYTAFAGKRNAKTREIFRILFARALQNRGDTKVSNLKLATLTKQSQRSVVRHIKRLENKGFLVTVKKIYSNKQTGTVNFRTGRIIRVWQAFAIGGYSPFPTKHAGFENDIRPHVPTEVLHKIPLKYKIARPMSVQHPKSQKIKRINSEMLTMEKAVENGLLSQADDQWIKELLVSQGNRGKMGESVLGYSRDLMYFYKRLVAKTIEKKGIEVYEQKREERKLALRR